MIKTTVPTIAINLWKKRTYKLHHLCRFIGNYFKYKTCLVLVGSNDILGNNLTLGNNLEKSA